MTQIRAGAYAVWRYLIVLFVLVVLVQFFLAGVGVFNPTESSEPYDPHSAVGFLGQPALAEFNSWGGPFHPINGLIILGLSVFLMRRAWGWGAGPAPSLEPSSPTRDVA
ncbi:MAG: hypothetical protein ACRDNP_04130 [Gaiellaceae bacterium]